MSGFGSGNGGSSASMSAHRLAPPTATTGAGVSALHLQYAAAAEAAARPQSMRASGRGIMQLLAKYGGDDGGGSGGDDNADPFTRAQRLSARGLTAAAASAAAAAAVSSSAAYHSVPALSSSRSSALHPSASNATTLPHFSHESLGAYQLRIPTQLAGELFSLRHNSGLSVHQKVATCLAALERLANDCIVDHAVGERTPEQAQAHAILQLLSSSRTSAAAAAAAAAAGSDEEQLDGVPLSTHQAALRATILNLRSMLQPLLVAPRAMFQGAINRAEEVAVQHGAVRFETDDASPDSTGSARLGPGGTPLLGPHSVPSAPAANHAAPAFASLMPEHAHSLLTSTGGLASGNRRQEERLAKEERLRQVDQLLLEQESELESRAGAGGSIVAAVDESKESHPAADAADDDDALLSSPHNQTSYKLVLSRDDDSGLSNNEVPYPEVVRTLQWLKSALQRKLLANESKYLDTLSHMCAQRDEMAQLRHQTRSNDVKFASSTRSDATLQKEFVHLREKLNDNYGELKKLRAKVADMKREMKKQRIDGGLSSRGAGKEDARSLAAANRAAKKSLEDIVLTLKEKGDELSKLQRVIRASNAEKDNLTTQLEILQQAVQAMRYLIQHILDEQTKLLASSNPPPSSSGGSNPRGMIACKGIGKNVPPFLAYSGWVQRYDLGKRNTELIIKEIWSLKAIADEHRRKSGMTRTTLPEFFLRYLRARFPEHATSTQARHRMFEFVYNFVESCDRYRSDHDMSLFVAILFGTCSEERYIDQMKMCAYLKTALTQMDIIDGVRDGLIQKQVFFAGLRQFFPIKSEANMRALIDIVLREMQSPSSSDPHCTQLSVDISKLMAETSDGDESAFMEAIRSQYEEEINAFPQQIAASLYKASKDLFGSTGAPNNDRSIAGPYHLRQLSSSGRTTANVGEGWLPAGQIAAILQDLDPAKSKHEIEAYMRRGLGLDGYFQSLPGGGAIGGTHLTSLRDAGVYRVGGHQSVAHSRASTPQHPQLSPVPRDSGPAPGTPQSGRDASASNLARKGSSNNLTSPPGLATSASAASVGGHQHRKSISGASPPSRGSTPGPTHDRSASGSLVSSAALASLHTTARSNSRLSMAGLAIVSPRPMTGGQSGERIISARSASPSPGAIGSSAPSASPPSGGRESRRASRGGSRRSSRGLEHARSASRAAASPTHRSNLSFAAGAGGVSYDPAQLVELAPFLERLNTLFLHRTGHYNADLDVAGLARLIKDELERVADEERKAREIAAAKKGLGTGLQVSAMGLPSWATQQPSYRRSKDNPHIRDDVLARIIRKYALSENDPAARQLTDEQGQPIRARVQVELQREGGPTSAPALEEECVTLRYGIDAHLNQVVALYRGDATKLQIDAVVNAANPQLVAGGGICAAIFAAAGHQQLNKACARLGGCAYGQTKLTPGFKLPARFILHSVSPVDNSNSAALESCYTSILDLCLAHSIRSVAMCCLATGIGGFKNADAAEIALRTTREWLERSERHRRALDRLVFCVFLEEDAAIYNNLLPIFFPGPPHDKTKPATPVAGTRVLSSPSAADAAVDARPSLLKKATMALFGGPRRSSNRPLELSAEAMRALEHLESLPDGGEAKSPATSPRNAARRSLARRRSSLGLSPEQIAALFPSAPAPLSSPPAAAAASVAPPAANPFTHRPGANLARYRYEVPRLSQAATYQPRTAAQLFGDSASEATTMPARRDEHKEKGEETMRRDTYSHASYTPHRTGQHAHYAPSPPLLQPLASANFPLAAAPRSSPRGTPKRHTPSLQSLAKLMRNDDDQHNH